MPTGTPVARLAARARALSRDIDVALGAVIHAVEREADDDTVVMAALNVVTIRARIAAANVALRHLNHGGDTIGLATELTAAAPSGTGVVADARMAGHVAETIRIYGLVRDTPAASRPAIVAPAGIPVLTAPLNDGALV